MWRLIPRELRFFDDFERQPEHVVRAASLLHALVDNFSDVPAAVKAIKDVEHDGDQLLRQSLASLFELEGDAIEILKWKEIYETLEAERSPACSKESS